MTHRWHWRKWLPERQLATGRMNSALVEFDDGYKAMTYPTELVEKAKYETHVFERVSANTGIALIEEVERLRTAAEKVIEMNRFTALHQYGDADKAETWACVRTLREVLPPNAEVSGGL